MPETYVHRIGRSGRAGKNGVAISFCDHTERAYVKDIQKLIGKKLNIVDEHPFPQSAVDPALSENKDDKQNNNNRNTGNRNKKKLDKRKPPKSKFTEKRAKAVEGKKTEQKDVAHNKNPKKTHPNDSKNANDNQNPKDGNPDKSNARKKKPFNKKKRKKGMPEGLKKKMMWPLD